MKQSAVGYQEHPYLFGETKVQSMAGVTILVGSIFFSLYVPEQYGLVRHLYWHTAFQLFMSRVSCRSDLFAINFVSLLFFGAALFDTLAVLYNHAHYYSIIITAVYVAFSLIYIHKLSAFIRVKWWKREPPFITGSIPWLGEAVFYGMNPRQYLQDKQQKHGSIFTMYTAGDPVTVILDNKEQRNFYGATEDELLFFEPLYKVRLPDVIGTALQSSTANILMHLLPKEHIPQFPRHPDFFLRDMNRFVEKHVRLDESNSASVALWPFVDRLIVILSCRALCAPMGDNTEFVDGIIHLEYLATQLIKKPGVLGLQCVQECRDQRKVLVKHLVKELADRRSLTGGVDVPQTPDESTTMDLMDIIRYNTKDDDDFIIDSIIGVLFGAVANTNAALYFVFAHLMSNPKLLSDIETEITEVLEESQGVVKKETLNKLPLLDSLIAEVTRYYAIVLSMRYTAKEIPVGDYIIPKNRIVAFSSSIRMRENSGLKNADHFDPYRYVKGDDTKEWIATRRAYLGFGKGPHYCKGMDLAKLELRLFTVMFINQFKIHYAVPDWSKEWISLGLAIPMGNAQLRVTKRDQPLAPLQ